MSVVSVTNMRYGSGNVKDPWGSLKEELDYIFLASVGRGVGVGVGKRR